jgi:hypothetical protein
LSRAARALEVENGEPAPGTAAGEAGREGASLEPLECPDPALEEAVEVEEEVE